MSDKPKPGNVKLTGHASRGATIFDSDPPTAEELAEWKKQWGKEWLDHTFKTLTPHQKKEFEKRLNPRLVSGRAKGAQAHKAKAHKRKVQLQTMCADLCARYPHYDLEDHVKHLGRYTRFKDPEGNDYDFSYKSIRTLKEIIRPTFEATKAALKNQKK